MEMSASLLLRLLLLEGFWLVVGIDGGGTDGAAAAAAASSFSATLDFLMVPFFLLGVFPRRFGGILLLFYCIDTSECIVK